MKLIACLAFASTFSAWAAPCGGEAVGYWKNPDGSRGGWVGKDAKVEAGAYIAPTAEVCESARIQNGAKILGMARISGRAVIASGAEISGSARVSGEAKIGGGGSNIRIDGNSVVEDSAVITGSSKVFGRAKIGGGANVHDSSICQASSIQSIKVHNSNYYCQTEDPEPPHPGSAGKKTLLGVDSDRDGVRDDVEIWINDYYSNTAYKDNYSMRMVMKQMAYSYYQLIRNKNDKVKVKQIFGEIFDSSRCLHDIYLKGEKDLNSQLKLMNSAEENRMELQSYFFNTPDRIGTHMGLEKLLHGSSLAPARKTKNGCYFEMKE